MPELSRTITLIELLAITAFSCYIGVDFLPLSAVASGLFFLLACMPLYAIILDVFANKQIIKGPMEDFVQNSIVLLVAIGNLSKTPELAVLCYSAATLAAIDMCVNILNFVSPQKEFLTYKNATIHKTAGVLAIAEWVLMATVCILVVWTFWGQSWWITGVFTAAFALLIYIFTAKRNNPGNSAPIGGIILDLFGLALGIFVYFHDADYHAIILCALLIICIDLSRSVMRKTCTISSLEQL
ncbi:MAG: hypothetical protein K2F96_09065 [Muribaculaceae bacterium]|nr:hypothetical protein [Muribaculaceae bacterium]